MRALISVDCRLAVSTLGDRAGTIGALAQAMELAYADIGVGMGHLPMLPALEIAHPAVGSGPQR